MVDVLKSSTGFLCAQRHSYRDVCCCLSGEHVVSLSFLIFGFASAYHLRASRPLLKLFDQIWSFKSGDTVCVFVLKASFGVYAEKTKPFKVIGKTEREWSDAFWNLPSFQSTLLQQEAFLLVLAAVEGLVVGKCIRAAASQYNRHHANDCCLSPALQVD